MVPVETHLRFLYCVLGLLIGDKVQLGFAHFSILQHKVLYSLFQYKIVRK